MALFEPIFQALEDAGVRYVAVGGVAVVLQGHARLTTNLDLTVDLAPEPAARAIETFIGIGFEPRLPVDPSGFADAATRQAWINDKGMTVFSLWDRADPTRSVDLFVAEPIPFEELWARSEVVALEGTQAQIASISDLIAMKKLSNRPLDLDDIEALTTLRLFVDSDLSVRARAAAERGRLKVQRDDQGRWQSSKAWVEDCRLSRHERATPPNKKE